MNLPFWLRRLIDRRKRAHRCVDCNGVSTVGMWEPWKCSECGAEAYYLGNLLKAEPEGKE